MRLQKQEYRAPRVRKKLIGKIQKEERGLKKRQKNLAKKKMNQTLAILKPGKYLMLNRNHYMRFLESVSVLLVDSYQPSDLLGSTDYIALHNENLIIVGKNEVKIQ